MLHPLGDPTRVELVNQGRRGGLMLRAYTVAFAAKSFAVYERIDDAAEIDSWVIAPE
jgi:hypothetical protein